MTEDINYLNKRKISRNWYLASITLAIVTNFVSYIIVFDYEAEFMLFSTTSVLLVLAYYLKNFIAFQEDDIENSDQQLFPEFILGKNGIIQNANESFIKKYASEDCLEIGRNFATQIPPSIFNKMISPLFFGKPLLVILRSKNDSSIKNYISITKGPSNTKDNFQVLLFSVEHNDNSFDSESHQQRLQAIGQLAIGISHDFNNVLTAIRGYSDLLQERVPENSELFEDVVQIKENCQRASSLVKQLLTFSKKHEVKYSKLDLYHVVSQTYKLLGRLLGEKIEINISKQSENNFIMADKNQIEQVIMNLALNAKDAMVRGGKLLISINHLNVTQSKRDSLYSLFRPSGSGEIEDGNYVELQIEDTGEGIEENILTKIFEPFFTTKDELKGTGLGLSTVFEIIKQTGGHLFVQSSPKGTKFKLLFKEIAVLTKPNIAKNQTYTSDDNLDAKAVVLVVEDEEPVRVFSAHALRNKGFKVYEAENAEQALEIFQQNKDQIDILITDVIMPGINGPELASKIKEIKSNINVILMSGYTEEEISPLSNDQFQFLSKPFSLNKLVETVNNACVTKEVA